MITAKNKFVTKTIENYQYSNNYETENFLLRPTFNTRKNNIVELSKLDSDNLEIPYKTNQLLVDNIVSLDNIIQSNSGRGFSFLPKSSRTDNDNFKYNKEKNQNIRFDFLYKSQDPKNIEINLPRGESTRKENSNSLIIDVINRDKTNIIFEYE